MMPVSFRRFKELGPRKLYRGNIHHTVRLDVEVYDEVIAYARKQNIAVSTALAELVVIALDTIIDGKNDDRIKKTRDNERARKVAARTFDFRRDCFACGASDTLIHTHGHTQCSKCGANVEPCCDN